MRVGIASDHGGFVLKEQIAKLLRDAAYEAVSYTHLDVYKRQLCFVLLESGFGMRIPRS